MNVDDNEEHTETSQQQLIFDAVAALISVIGKPEFYPRLAHFLKQRASSDSIVILGYHRQLSPQVLYEDLAPLDRQALFGPYFEGAYFLSPFYLMWKESEDGAQLYRLQEIAPEGFFNSIYYTDYYARSGLLDELGYLIPVGDESAVLVSLGRTEKLNAYSKAEQLELDMVKSLVESGIKLHSSLLVESPSVQFKKQLSDTFLTFGSDILTAQERRVVQMMLRGHSSKSCARELGISPTTERVHRRNIYAKMDISSQADLFILFFDTLAAEDQAMDKNQP